MMAEAMRNARFQTKPTFGTQDEPQLRRSERRKDERHSWGGLAQIKSGAWTFPRECKITDISDGGVRIYAEYVNVPERFEIIFGGPLGRTRHCEVVWRLGHEVGAKFVDPPQRGFVGRLLGR